MTIHRNPSVTELERLLYETPGLKFMYAHSPACPSCKDMTPLIEQLSTGYEGRLTLISVDVALRPEVWEAFEMSGIPAYFVINEGEVIAEGVGTLTTEQLNELVATAK